MRFESWPLLLLLGLIPFFLRRWERAAVPPRIKMGLPTSVTSIAGGGAPFSLERYIPGLTPLRISLLLKIAAVVLTLMALARPQNAHRSLERIVSGIDVMMVMDFSQSMNIEDLAERSRFDVARQVMEQFIQGRNNDRIGFVIFSGEAMTLAPPTLDYALVLKSLRDAKIGVLKDGTAIGDGLSTAVARLKNSTAKSRVIILLTDGDNNVGQVDPATAGDLAAGYGIRVYSIAVGREGRVRLPIKRPGMFGNTITTYQWFENALNPEILEHISKITQGRFYRVTDADTLERVFKEIDQLEKSEVKSKEHVEYEELFQKFLIVALFLLAIEKVLTTVLWRVIP